MCSEASLYPIGTSKTHRSLAYLVGAHSSETGNQDKNQGAMKSLALWMPWKATGECAASVLVDGPGRKGLAKELRLGTMKRDYERLLEKPSCTGRPQNIGDASTMG